MEYLESHNLTPEQRDLFSQLSKEQGSLDRDDLHDLDLEEDATKYVFTRKLHGTDVTHEIYLINEDHTVVFCGYCGYRPLLVATHKESRNQIGWDYDLNMDVRIFINNHSRSTIRG